MTPGDNAGTEFCIVCGKEISGAQGITHLYHDGRRFALCCPTCVEMFKRAPARFASGERPMTIVQELLDELRWKENDR